MKKLEADGTQRILALIRGAETFVFQSDFQKYRDQNLQDSNIAYCFVWYEIWSLTMSKGYRIRVLTNRVLRKTFGL